MDIWHGLDDIPQFLDASVVTIGVFDGVHRGHRRLISTAVRRARELGVPCVLMTFEPHPVKVFAPERTPRLLGTLDERQRWADELGVDYFLTVDFTRSLAALSPTDYIEQVLVGLLHAVGVVVGENFTFGHKAAGTSHTLAAEGPRYGCDVEIVPLFAEDGHTVSSTYIRSQLDCGNVIEAGRALGRAYSVSGEVEHGAGRGGRELGFPTANLYVGAERALPADGVYAGWLTIESDVDVDGDMDPGVKYPAAISVGMNPTFNDNRRSVEAFVLDKNADLYGLYARVEFIDYLRSMEKFEGIDDLLAAMRRDVDCVRMMTQRTGD
ncbi:bifunctional riboflavin kinase/FAD synthetase [Corynebacterium kroppenstedtii]|uniref:bifunctional riboflavin kinase/FAD synthetase n=1 Tax=Corynebacterium sp. PCR 32 TaxID=3351342 RepID=UPI00309EC875